MSALRSAICSDRFSAHIALHPSRLKDEPLWGFISLQIFELVKPLDYAEWKKQKLNNSI